MFIVFEGADGTGKSTVAKWLHKTVSERLPPAMQIKYEREPTEGPFGQEIRRHRGNLTPLIGAALFMADRLRHVREVVIPSVQGAASHLILDRYFYSTVAYQSCHETIELDWKALLDDALIFCPQPDILLLFECDPEVAMKRIATRGEIDLNFERKDYQIRVRDRFREIVPHTKTLVIDTTDIGIEAACKAAAMAVCSRSKTFELLLESFL